MSAATNEEIQKKLLEYDYLLQNLERARKEREGLVPWHVLDALKEFDGEVIAPAENELEKIAEWLEEAVVDKGESIEAFGWKIEFREAPTIWDRHALQEYAAKHPDINECCRTGRSAAVIKRAINYENNN